MKFTVDENLPSIAAAVLRKQGHDALLVLDQVAAGTAVVHDYAMFRSAIPG